MALAPHPFEAPRLAAKGSELRSSDERFAPLFNGLNFHDSVLQKWERVASPPSLSATVDLDLFWAEPGAGTPSDREDRRLELVFEGPTSTKVEGAGREDAAFASLENGMVILDEIRCARVAAIDGSPAAWEFHFAYCVSDCHEAATLVQVRCESFRLRFVD
jgi:hypothetical protein